MFVCTCVCVRAEGGCQSSVSGSDTAGGEEAVVGTLIVPIETRHAPAMILERW